MSDVPNAGSDPGSRDCNKIISEQLDDVEISSYWRHHNGPPESGSPVDLTLEDGRPAVRSGSLVIGYLPFDCDYLVACIRAGSQYVGTVRRHSYRDLFVELRLSDRGTYTNP
jgi:hypothetical protein